MSTSITFSKIDRQKADQLFLDIKSGAFQEKALEIMPKLEEKLANTPEVTSEEIYSPEYNTPEYRNKLRQRGAERAELEDQYSKYKNVISALKYITEKDEEDDFDSNARYLADAICAFHGDSYNEPASTFDFVFSTLFKHIGIDYDTFDDLEELSLEDWIQIFKKIDKTALTSLKNDLDSDPYYTFAGFVGFLKDIRDIIKGCDNENFIFNLSIEGDDEKLSQYELDLIKKIKDTYREYDRKSN